MMVSLALHTGATYMQCFCIAAINILIFCKLSSVTFVLLQFEEIKIYSPLRQLTTQSEFRPCIVLTNKGMN